MHLTQIDRVNEISKEEFTQNYLLPKKPVVIKSLVQDWPATSQWSFQYLINAYGHLDVPIVGPDFHTPGPNYMRSQETMKFGDYLQLIQAGPTEKRIFLWNIFEHAPKLIQDVSNHGICGGWVDKYPFMFFGGAGAVTTLHYDIDCSHVFHTHFQSTKHVILFPPKESQKLYKHPFTVQSRVDPMRPDYVKFPALKHVFGYETILSHGETLFIPSLWWHHIKYLGGGYSLSLRSAGNLASQARGVYNISRHFLVDKGMNALLGSKWKDWKERTAARRAMASIRS